MSWGYHWGGGAWGDGGGGGSLAAGFYVLGALATASNAFQVEFSEPPKLQSPIGADDAANLANWTLIRTDTNEPVAMLTVRPVPGYPTRVEIAIVGAWASDLVEYEVMVANVISTVPNSLIDPKIAFFKGLPAAAELADQFQPLVDVRNPQVEKNEQNGALVVNTAGDYQLEEGVPLLRKLVLRRLVTAQGEFYHLSDQQYGLGIAPSQLYTTGDLVGLKTSIERQVMLEPEVAACRAQVDLFADNRLEVKLRVTLRRTGQQLTLSLPLQQSSLQETF